MSGIFSSNNIPPVIIRGEEKSVTARGLFQKALAGRWLYRFEARLLRRRDSLVELDEVSKSVPLGDRHVLGRREVPIDRIIGTESKAQDFDGGFHPRSEWLRERWMRVAAAILSREPVPPVELIKVGDVYFVRDGHHRVSVSRTLGLREIEANVIVWEIADPYRQPGFLKNIH